MPDIKDTAFYPAIQKLEKQLHQELPVVTGQPIAEAPRCTKCGQYVGCGAH